MLNKFFKTNLKLNDEFSNFLKIVFKEKNIFYENEKNNSIAVRKACKRFIRKQDKLLNKENKLCLKNLVEES